MVVKSTPDTIEAIKQILAELDRAPRNLMITVRHGISDNLHQSGYDAGVLIDEGDVSITSGNVDQGATGSQATVRVYDSRSTTDGQDVQRVRVLEGARRFIRFGESIPIAQRSLILFGNTVTVQDTVQYQDVTSGFYVLPRLNGDQVFLHISPRRAKLSELGGGAIEIQEATTAVSGRLGDWIAIGGSTNQADHGDSGNIYSTRSYEARSHSMFLRVDLVN